MNLGRRCAGAIVVALALVVTLATFSHAANATTAYRYWTYYIAAPNTSVWTYSQRGPAFEHPQDGEVQGWRFAVQADRAGGLIPRVSADFAKLCGSQQQAPGKVRVGIVLDFGVAADAPAGERPPATVVTGCVQVADGGSGVDVLDAAVGAANVRIGQGLICGIDGYPKIECAVAVSAPTATATPTTAKPPTTTAKSTAAPAVTPSASPTAPTPTAAASRPSGTTAPPSSAPTSSTLSPSASDSGTASITPLAALKKPKHKVFPTGAVIGVVLVLALAIAAAVRGSGARR